MAGGWGSWSKPGSSFSSGMAFSDEPMERREEAGDGVISSGGGVSGRVNNPGRVAGDKTLISLSIDIGAFGIKFESCCLLFLTPQIIDGFELKSIFQ